MNTKTKQLVAYYGSLEALVAAYDGNYTLYSSQQSPQYDISDFWPDFSDGAVKEKPKVEVTVRDVCGIKVYETKNSTDWEI